MTSPPDVLVVGAGPTGLALALQAHDHGARVRIVERRPEAGRPSRALVVHPRTLEVLRPRGVTEEILARADTSPRGVLHLGSRVARVGLAQLALPDTPFPHLTIVRQMDVESILSTALADRGVPVERGTELVELAEAAAARDQVSVTLRSAKGIEEASCRYVAGCDGPASTVRAGAGIEWRGAPYAEEVVLADLELEGDVEPGVAHVVAGRRGLLFLFSIGEWATWRLLATRPAGREPLPFGQPGPPVPAAELQGLLDAADFDARIGHLAWSARVPLQHRLASRFRRGRLFLAGDAAHAHSPAGAQGMNTGIQDAMNLGWKLAFATKGAARHQLLESYERERRPLARRVVALTHLVFWAEASSGPLPSFLRSVVAPLAAPGVPVLMRRRRLVAEAVRVLSQLRVGYRSSPLSVEETPRVRRGPSAGDRLADATVASGGQRVRLHDLLACPGVHVLAHRDTPDLGRAGLGPMVHVHRLADVAGSGIVAVRPDGYVGFRGRGNDPDQLRNWLALVGAAG